MKSEIIAVGTELLIGQIVNTNARYISRKLNEHGISVYYQSVVGDNKQRIIETLNTAILRSDLIVITGGLGPTEDDITKETVCELMNMQLLLDEDILKTIKGYFNSRNIEMTKNNMKQAFVPEKAHILHNQKGTAPGFYIIDGNKRIVVLPGPPIEMQPMFDNFLNIYLSKENTIYSKYINIFGVGESAVEDKIIDLIRRDENITLATYASIGQVIIRITTMAENDRIAETKMKEIIDELYKRFGKNIFSDEEITLPIKISRLLYEKNKTLAIAESCTGGLISKIITDQPGASKIYLGGVVAYNNSIKKSFLNIDETVIDTYGAVSEEVCKEMVLNIIRSSASDYGIAVTGIAGPTGDTEDKPVGTVYIGVSDGSKTKIKRFFFNGDRNKIRNMSAMTSLDMLRREFL